MQNAACQGILRLVLCPKYGVFASGCFLFGVCLFGLCAFCLPFRLVVKSIATICVYIFLRYFCFLFFSYFRLRFSTLLRAAFSQFFQLICSDTDAENRLRMSFDQVSIGFSWLRLSQLPFGKLKCASREPKAKTRFVAKRPRAAWGNCDCNYNCISSNLAMHEKREKQFKAVFETVFLEFFLSLCISFVAAAWWHNSRASRRPTPRPNTRTFSTLEQTAFKCCSCCCNCCCCCCCCNWSRSLCLSGELICRFTSCDISCIACQLHSLLLLLLAASQLCRVQLRWPADNAATQLTAKSTLMQAKMCTDSRVRIFAAKCQGNFRYVS